MLWQILVAPNLYPPKPNSRQGTGKGTLGELAQNPITFNALGPASLHVVLPILITVCKINSAFLIWYVSRNGKRG